MSWGKGVGVGSAEWSGTTNRSKDKRIEDEDDKGTEPTTYRKGRVDKGDRAGEVVKGQRRMGSQASSIGNKQRQLGSGSGSQVNLAVPVLQRIPAASVTTSKVQQSAESNQTERKIGSQRSFNDASRKPPGISRSTSQVNLTVPLDTRFPPTPLLSLPRHPSPAPTPPLVHASQSQSKRPHLKPLGSETSAGSARSIRDAYIESALHLPIEILSAKDPNPIPKAKANDGVKKSKSNISTKTEGDAKRFVSDAAREAPSGGKAAVRASGEIVKIGVYGVGRSQTSAAVSGSAKSGKTKRGDNAVSSSKPKAGIPLEPVKTRPRSTSRNDQPPSRPGIVEIPTPENPYLDLPTPPVRHATLAPPSPALRSPSQRHKPVPSSPIVTAASPPRAKEPDDGPKARPTLSRRPIPAHREPTPMLRPALSRSASSFDRLRKRLDRGVPDLQARFEPNMYPLPASGTTTELGLSPVRPGHTKAGVTSLGSATSHKSRIPIMIDLDPSLTPGSSYDVAQPPLNASAHIYPTPRRDPISPISGDSPTAEGDRIAFEIPSGTRGRLRVSLAWFRDVKSPSKRWKDRIHVRGSRKASVDEDNQPPPLPIKDGKWSYNGNEGRDQGFRPSSPGYEGDRYRPNFLRRDRHRPSPPASPSSSHRYSPLPRPVERERDRVRFSPEPPPNMARSHIAWAQTANPYLTVPGIPGLPGSFPPPHPYRPNTLQPPAPFQPYPPPHPNTWAAMSLPNIYNPSAPRTQAPPSPRPSIDPPSDTSLPRMDQPLPGMYPNRPLNYPAPISMAYPQPGPTGFYDYRNTNVDGQNGYKSTKDLPWSGGPTMWQRMFRASNREGDNQWDQRRDGKEGLIRNWRRNIQSGKGTTVFGDGYRQDGYRKPERGYRVEGGRRGWFTLPGLGQRARRDNQDMRNDGRFSGGKSYRASPPRFEHDTSQWRIWPFSEKRRNRTYRPPDRITPTAYTQPQRVLSPVRNSRERAKEERRAQRKERRDRRDLGLRPGDTKTLHPDDSVTRAAGTVGRPSLSGRGRSGTMVRDWVEMVSRPAKNRTKRDQTQEGNKNVKVSWKKRLNSRQQSQGVIPDGKLRRSDSRKREK